MSRYINTHHRTADGAIAVTFGDNPVERPGFCGLVSNVSWGNPDTVAALRQLFGCKSDEQIVAIEVTANGIKAKFERM